MGFEQYRVVIAYDKESEEFVATVPELPSFSELRATTREELVEGLDDALDAAAQQEIAEIGSLPTPIDDAEEGGFDGLLEVELGVSLHRALAHRALAEKTTVEALAANVISLYLGGKLLGGEQRYERRERQSEGRGRRKGGRSSYHAVMEDKAHFMEYVRQQERTYGSGGGNRGPRRRRGGGRDDD